MFNICLIFFFWISAWLGSIGRYRPIRTESAWFGPRRRRFQPCWPDLGIATWHDAARTRGLWRPSRVAASRRVGRGCAGLGAASWEGTNNCSIRISNHHSNSSRVDVVEHSSVLVSFKPWMIWRSPLMRCRQLVRCGQIWLRIDVFLKQIAYLRECLIQRVCWVIQTYCIP